MKNKQSYYLLFASSLVLGACSLGTTPEYKAGSSEELLAAEGEWKLVEEKRSPSPIQKHMKSRGKVKATKSKSYTEDAQSMGLDKDINFRVLRLERQMNTVRSDLESIKPKLALLPEKRLNIPHTQKKTQTKAAPKKHTKTHASTGPLRVLNVRLGQHPGKTRFVIDLSAAPKFSHDLDNGEHLLLIELPATGWSAQTKKSLNNNPLIKAYSVQTASDGTSRLAIELKKPVQILMAKTFKPNQAHGHRIVFDIAGL